MAVSYKGIWGRLKYFGNDFVNFQMGTPSVTPIQIFVHFFFIISPFCCSFIFLISLITDWLCLGMSFANSLLLMISSKAQIKEYIGVCVCVCLMKVLLKKAPPKYVNKWPTEQHWNYAYLSIDHVFPARLPIKRRVLFYW